jgi:hypothetical protein
MLRIFGAALLLAFGLAITAVPARALHVFVTKVDRNNDGSVTYHFAVKMDEGETLTPGEPKETSDFVTVLFGGMAGFASIFGLLLQVLLIIVVARLIFAWWQRPCQTDRPQGTRQRGRRIVHGRQIGQHSSAEHPH